MVWRGEARANPAAPDVTARVRGPRPLGDAPPPPPTPSDSQPPVAPRDAATATPSPGDGAAPGTLEGFAA